MDQLLDAHYFMLPTQGNIYSLSVLTLCSGVNKLIVASLKKKIFSFEYCEGSAASLKPMVREISCTYIPSGAEIISLDAFNKSSTCDDLQIGIAISKPNTEGSPETYLNIYSEQDLDSNYALNIDSIAQNCLMIELNFIPYHLTHTYVLNQQDGSDSKDIVWLLSGSDGKIHVFQEDHQNHSYAEVDITDLFPELSNPPSIVMWIDVNFTHNFARRVSVIGCECGTVQLSVVNTKSNVLVSTHSDVFDGPVSQVRFFSLFPDNVDLPECFTTEDLKEENDKPSKSGLHLVVCNTLEPCAVYMNVEEGFSDKHSLEESERYDACLCACVADTNMDGYNEILLGTYGQKILMYTLREGKWELSGRRSTSNPVHSLHYVDLSGDGVNELVVQTLSGVHIMQHDPEQVYHVLMSRLKKLRGIEEESETPTIEIQTPVVESDDCLCKEAREHEE